MTRDDLLLLALAGPFAVHRALRLLIRDRILRGPRSWLLRRLYQRRDPLVCELTAAEVEDFAAADSDPPTLVYLATCWWCLGLWVAAGWVAACWAWWGVMRWVTLAAAFSTQAVVLSTAMDRLEA